MIFFHYVNWLALHELINSNDQAKFNFEVESYKKPLQKESKNEAAVHHNVAEANIQNGKQVMRLGMLFISTSYYIL